MLDHSHAASTPDGFSHFSFSSQGTFQQVIPLAALAELREIALDTAGASKEAVGKLAQISNNLARKEIRDIATLMLCEVALSEVFSGSRVAAIKALERKSSDPIVAITLESLAGDATTPERIREEAEKRISQPPHPTHTVEEVKEVLAKALIDLIQEVEGKDLTASFALEKITAPAIDPIREVPGRQYGPFENFEEFLGYDRCPIDLKEIAPGAGTKVLFLPWRHVAENVPPLVKEIEKVVEARPEVKKMVVLAECVAEQERKEFINTHLNAYINGSPKESREALIELSQPLRDEQGRKIGKLNPTFIELGKELRRVKGDSDLHIEFSAIDITDPELLKRAKAELTGTATQMMSGVLMLAARPSQLKQALLTTTPEEEKREALKDLVLEREELKIRMLERLLTTRNAVMSAQTHEARSSLDEDDLLVVLSGAAHAAIVYDGLVEGNEAYRYIGIPQRFLDAVPESISLQEMTDLASKTAIELSMGKPIALEDLERAALETILSSLTAMEVVKEGVLSFGFSRPSPEVRGGVARGYVIRSFLMMTPPEEIRRVIDTIVDKVVEGRETKGEKTIYGICSTTIKEWLCESSPECRTKSGFSYSKWLDQTFDRYLRVKS